MAAQLKLEGDDLTTPKEPEVEAEIGTSRADEYVTVDQLAEILDMNRNTIYRWAKEGTIRGVVRVGTLIRIHLPTFNGN